MEAVHEHDDDEEMTLDDVISMYVAAGRDPYPEIAELLRQHGYKVAPRDPNAGPYDRPVVVR